MAQGNELPLTPQQATDEPSQKVKDRLTALASTVVPSRARETTPKARAFLFGCRNHEAVNGLLPMGKVALIYAAGGVGKTFLACDLGVAVALGRPFLGAMPIMTSGKVLLLLGEEDAEEAERRIHYVTSQDTESGTNEALDKNLVIVPLAGEACELTHTEQDRTGNLPLTDFARGVIWFAREQGPWALIVVDPLSRFAGADAEKDNAAATRFIQVLEALAKVNPAGTTAPVVLATHHTSQEARQSGNHDATAARGVTGLTDGVRWAASLTAKRLVEDAPELLTFRITKSNYGPKHCVVVCRQQNGRVRMATDNEIARYEEMVSLIGPQECEKTSGKCKQKKGIVNDDHIR